MTVLYPVGYGHQKVTLEALRGIHGLRMHPEFNRRLFAWLEAQGGEVGIGGGWRSVQPVKPGFAPPGKSFHQSQRFASGQLVYAAVDLVHVNGDRIHRSPNWSEVPRAGSKEATKSGLHCFIGSEPWHMQCVEMRGYASWVNAGRPDPRSNYPLPDGSSPVPAPTPTPQPQPPKPPTPQPTPGKEITVQFTTQAVKVGDRGPHVRRLQEMLNDLMGRGLATDGHCGLLTVAAIMDWQRLMRNNASTKNTAVDGIAGPVTLGSITTAWFAKG